MMYWASGKSLKNQVNRQANPSNHFNHGINSAAKAAATFQNNSSNINSKGMVEQVIVSLI